MYLSAYLPLLYYPQSVNPQYKPKLIKNVLFQVKRSIMLKMADACADSSKQTRFHEMHVQRHNNVSILYADIVNFTPLSERLSASDLVKTLNELFGRFDQIAQVLVSIHFGFCVQLHLAIGI